MWNEGRLHILNLVCLQLQTAEGNANAAFSGSELQHDYTTGGSDNLAQTYSPQQRIDQTWPAY